MNPRKKSIHLQGIKSNLKQRNLSQLEQFLRLNTLKSKKKGLNSLPQFKVQKYRKRFMIRPQFISNYYGTLLIFNSFFSHVSPILFQIDIPAKDQVTVRQKFKPKVVKPSETSTIESGPLKETPPVVKRYQFGRLLFYSLFCCGNCIKSLLRGYWMKIHYILCICCFSLK